MIVLPFQVNATEYCVFVVLQDDNLTRITAYDPAEVNVAKMPGPWQRLKLSEVMIGYATDAEVAAVTELCQQDKAKEALRLLSRGFRYRPGSGDHDNPYTSLAHGEGEGQPS
jgi:hypothetical protein